MSGYDAYKDTFEANTFNAKTFASGAWRGGRHLWVGQPASATVASQQLTATVASQQLTATVALRSGT